MAITKSKIVPKGNSNESLVAKPHLRIEPAKGWSPISISELWGQRSLLFYLVLREVKATTHATKLGLLWVVLQPLATAAILSVVMGYLMRVPTGETPYPVVILSGLLIWSYLSNTLMKTSGSMIANAYLLTKVYFSRVIIPLVPVISGLIDMAIMLIVLITCCLYYGINPKPSWAILGIILPITITTAFGLGLWASALTVRFRDFGNLLPVVIQMGTYVSPVFYPSSLVPEKWRRFYELNPVAGLIDITRDSLLGGGHDKVSLLAYPAAFSVLVLITGIFFFRISEDSASDLV